MNDLLQGHMMIIQEDMIMSGHHPGAMIAMIGPLHHQEDLLNTHHHTEQGAEALHLQGEFQSVFIIQVSFNELFLHYFSYYL